MKLLSTLRNFFRPPEPPMLLHCLRCFHSTAHTDPFTIPIACPNCGADYGVAADNKPTGLLTLPRSISPEEMAGIRRSWEHYLQARLFVSYDGIGGDMTMGNERIVAVVTATLVGLVLAGTLPASAPVLAAAFGLTLVTAIFGGVPRKVVTSITALVNSAADVVEEIVVTVSPEEDE